MVSLGCNGIVLALLGVLVALPSARCLKPRIVGGYATSISRVPYLISLWQDGQFICGGSLIARQYVLSAAHCVYNVAPRRFEVHAHATYLSQRNAIVRQVKTYSLSKRYNPNTLYMDVTCIKLRRPMPNMVATIPISVGRLHAGDLVTVSGWGLRKETAVSVPNRVRSVRVPLLAHKRCKRMYQGRARVYGTMICASEAGTKDSCSGDSGGPLVYKNALAGIVSWGIGCARRNSPGVYTSCRAVLPFIKAAIKKL